MIPKHILPITKKNLSVVYYTSNVLDRENPYFLENTKKYLLKAIDDLPLIIVSQKPTLFGDHSINICMGDIGRSHLNCYRQILEGCRASKTKYVALTEDDILYSYDHFHTALPNPNKFLFDMSKWSIFTWTDPPLFSFRNNRRVVNSMIAERDFLIEALEERFSRVEVLMREYKERGIKNPEEKIIKYFGDPGRYEEYLGVTVRGVEEYYTTYPNIVFTHEYAFGYLSRGTHKKLGDIRAIEIPFWGSASDVLKLFYKKGESFNRGKSK